MWPRIVLIVAALPLFGCVTPGIVPSTETLDRLRVIAVIAVETPPLLAHPRTEAERAATLRVGLTLPGGYVGPAASTIAPPPVVMYRTVGATYVGLTLAALVASSVPREGEFATMTKDMPADWMPSPGLAKVAAQLLKHRAKTQVLVVEGYARLPVEDRSVNLLLENWMAPVRRWYNAESSMLSGTELDAGRVDAILEIGVTNYEWAFNDFIMHVHVKLSDAATKKVLGKARRVDYRGTQPMMQMLQDNGDPLRRLIETMGEDLLRKCLQDLKLI
jgi:hypothetical protein